MKTDLHRASQTAAAEVLSITDRQLRRLKDAPRRTDGYYDIPSLVRWKINTIEAEYLAASGDTNGQRSEGLERFRQARAELAEMELAERRGELWPAAEVKVEVAHAFEAAKRTLLGMPARIAPQIIGLSVEDAGQVMDGLIRGCLDDLGEALRVENFCATPAMAPEQ